MLSQLFTYFVYYCINLLKIVYFLRWEKSIVYTAIKARYPKYMNNLLSVKQAAFILRVHPLTVRRYIVSKKLKAIKVGGTIRIEESALQDFHKEIETPQEQPRIFKTNRLTDKQFTQDDPLLRLQGRGAGLVLQK